MIFRKPGKAAEMAEYFRLKSRWSRKAKAASPKDWRPGMCWQLVVSDDRTMRMCDDRDMRRLGERTVRRFDKRGVRNDG
jgi:hypothetical protein